MALAKPAFSHGEEEGRPWASGSAGAGVLGTLEKESTASWSTSYRSASSGVRACLIAKAGGGQVIYIMWTSLSSKHQLGLSFSSCVA
jgi:hypothetical protein